MRHVVPRGALKLPPSSPFLHPHSLFRQLRVAGSFPPCGTLSPPAAQRSTPEKAAAVDKRVFQVETYGVAAIFILSLLVFFEVVS